MSLATVAHPQAASLSQLVDGISSRTGSWLVVERLGTVLTHGAGQVPPPEPLTAALLTKTCTPLRRAVSWAGSGGPYLTGCVDAVPVTAVELGGGATAWFLGGPVDEPALPHLAAAARDDLRPITDPIVDELLHPRGLSRAGSAPDAVLVVLTSSHPLAAVSHAALAAIAGTDARVHTEPDAVVVALHDQHDVRPLLDAVRGRHADVVAGVMQVGQNAHDWTVAARVASAAARAATRLGRELGDSDDPAVAAELVIQEAQGAAGALLHVLGQGPLRRLEEHDACTSGQLVTTLRAWCHAGFDAPKSAAALHIHTNTLRYRVRRAAAISGLDLDQPRHLLALQLLL
jgi:hypothetical protein